jgi:hypothetical protein
MKTTSIMRNRIVRMLWLGGLLCLVAHVARADEKDPPTRVARISFTDGSVSLQPGGEGDWGSAAKNRPMTVGDKLWSDQNSRAELQAGQASLHLGSNTAVSFLNLDQNIMQVRLAEGSLNFRVRELREGDLYEVDTPNAAFTVHEAGAFRVDVNENGDSTGITVIRGEGEVTAGGKTYPLHTGERANFTGEQDVQYSIDQAPGPDGLDRWASERDLREDNSASAQYVSRDMPGYADLDDHGDWSEEPEYGHVWYPRDVPADWAPYSAGYWNWVGPWGWTWVDYEPWGFAPFHYGRWNYYGGRWGWAPGPFYGPAIYGPAFVGFLGGGFGFGFGGGFGLGVGWFPLGWGECYHPWYHSSIGYYRNVNIHNTVIRNTNVFNNTNIHNTNYAYAHNVNAVTTTSKSGFVNGQAVNRGAAHLSAASLKGAQVTNISAKPTSASAFGAGRASGHIATPPSGVQNRAVVARTAPAGAAAHSPVHTVNAAGLTAGRVGNGPVHSAGVAASANANIRPTLGGNNQRSNAPQAPAMSNRAAGTAQAPATMTARQRELAANRPPSAMSGGARTQGGINGAPPARNNAPATTSNPRSWAAQGNATDQGRAPQGAGQTTARPGVGQSERLNRINRPPWAGTTAGGAPGRAQGNPSAPSYGGNRAPSNNGNRSYAPPQRSAPSYNGGRGNAAPRSYSPPARSYSPPARSYSAPSRSYSAPSRSYSAPSQSYSAPSRSYSAPSRSYSAPSHSSAPAPSHSSGGGGGGSSHSSGGGGGGGGGTGAHPHR